MFRPDDADQNPHNRWPRRRGPRLFIPRLIEMYGAGVFAFDRLVRFNGFDQLNQTVADAQSGAVLKPVLRIT